jgi:AraC-like DNA-binding protein
MTEVIAQPISGEGAERGRGGLPDSLPVVLRTAVHVKVSQGRFRPPWSQRIVLVKWVISGEAAMRVNGRRIPFGPGDVAVYLPTQPHEFWAIAPVSEMCWFSTDGELAEQFAHMLGLRVGVYHYGPPPVAKIDEMIRSLSDQTLIGRRRSSELAVQLQYDVANRTPPPQVTSLVQQVRHLIQDGLADPALSAKGIAEQMNYNRGSLSRMFHRHAGLTIMDCITQMRLQQAEFLLQQTDDRIGDIARKCGFRDVSYFTRWVKKQTGRVPHKLRDVAAWTEVKAQQKAGSIPVGDKPADPTPEMAVSLSSRFPRR